MIARRQETYPIIFKNRKTESEGKLTPFINSVVVSFYPLTMNGVQWNARFEVSMELGQWVVSYQHYERADWLTNGKRYSQNSPNWDQYKRIREALFSLVSEWITSHPDEMHQAYITHALIELERLDGQIEEKQKELRELETNRWAASRELLKVTDGHKTATVQMVKCTGEAHRNPFIDNCPSCAPLWGERPMCSCGWEQPMKITDHRFVCRGCGVVIDRGAKARIKPIE